MLSQEISKLEAENNVLREALEELTKKMEQNEVVKPKSCQYCKHYVQYYIRNRIMFKTGYTPIHDGHCTYKVPQQKRRCRSQKPDDTCQYFEIGTGEMNAMEYKIEDQKEG